MRNIYPVVEGHGEVAALPILLRRLLDLAGNPDIGVGRPIRRTQAELHSETGIRKAVAMARTNKDCGAVLILFDGEDHCPKELAAKVEAWARGAAAGMPCHVVIAYREYETWFLSALESLRGRRGIAGEAVAPEDPEPRRGAKEALEAWMPRSRSYSETIDQPALSAEFALDAAWRGNRSFRKFVKSFGELLGGLGIQLKSWPPVGWET